MKRKPFVSVIIPFYNSYHTLYSCLDSVFKSRYKDFEIIAVNDCSKDNSLNIAERFSCKIINLNKRSGPAKARNIGAKNSNGDILIFLDSDCVVDENWLTNIVEDFKKYDVGCVAGQYKRTLNKNAVSKFAFYELFFREKKFSKFVKTIPSCNFACKRDIFNKAGGFSEKFRYSYTSEDLEFSYRLGKITKILWEPSIHVSHHFRNKISEYLRQQFSSSRDDVFLFLRQPKLLVADTFEDKTNYLEIILTTLSLALIPLFILDIINIYILFIPLLIIFITNIRFIKFIKSRESHSFYLKSLCFIYIRNIVWVFGVSTGIIKEFTRFMRG